jgi:hypothetical protein
MLSLFSEPTAIPCRTSTEQPKPDLPTKAIEGKRPHSILTISKGQLITSPGY